MVSLLNRLTNARLLVSGLASLALVALPASDVNAQKVKYETIK